MASGTCNWRKSRIPPAAIDMPDTSLGGIPGRIPPPGYVADAVGNEGYIRLLADCIACKLRGIGDIEGIGGMEYAGIGKVGCIGEIAEERLLG